MTELKTKPTRASVAAFLKAVDGERKREDCRQLVRLMRAVTGKMPKMWGDSIVGFGSYHYTYRSGREGDWPITGFSPRRQNLTIYIMPGFSDYAALLKKLGKHKTARSCLYLKKLDDVDEDVLRRLVASSVADMRRKYQCG